MLKFEMSRNSNLPETKIIMNKSEMEMNNQIYSMSISMDQLLKPITD